MAVLCFALLALAPAMHAESAPAPPSADGLARLVRDLSDEVYEHLVIREPDRRVYGMAYEFKEMPDGPLIQDFGLDAMHDGAWLMSALVTAHRMDPKAGHLERIQTTSVPFYVNLLRNSDRLFPNMLPREGQERFEQGNPIKGWAPRGWDDGPGMDYVTYSKGQPQPFSTGVVTHPGDTVVDFDEAGQFEQAYYTSSHHLFQDLADALLNVWLTTRDPMAAEAIALIDKGRVDHGIRIPVVQRATGFVTGDEKLANRAPVTFDPAKDFYPLWPAFVEKVELRLGHYHDGMAWEYREEAARAVRGGLPLDPVFVNRTVSRLLGVSLMTRAYWGAHWTPGMTLGNGSVQMKEGAMLRQGTEEAHAYSRGMQYAWIAAAVLPRFRQQESSWNEWVAALSREDRAALREGLSAYGVTLDLGHDAVVEEL